MENCEEILNKIDRLIKDICDEHRIAYERVVSGVERHSNPGGEDILLPIVQIVTYFEDVNIVTEVLGKEFDLAIIVNEAAHKSSWTEGFSAQQAHFLAALKPNRSELTEYKKWGARKFEIKLSSVLQEALTGIEKQLGFNASEPVSDDARRDFLRVGALLEMADKELAKIKKQTNNAAGNESQLTAGEPSARSITQVDAYAEILHSYSKPGDIKPSMPRTQTVAVNVVAPQKQQAQEPNNVPEMATQVAEPVKKQENEPAAPKVIHTAIKTEQTTDTGSVVVSVVSSAVASAPQNGSAINNNYQAPVTASNGITNKVVNDAAPANGNVTSKSEPAYTNGSNFKGDNTAISYESLKAFVQSSKLLKEADNEIATRAGARINDEIDIEGDVERLNFLQVFTIAQLHEKIETNKNEMISFAEKWIGRDNGGSFDSGISLFYLEYILVGQKNDPAFSVEYVLKFISDNDYSARYIIPTYNSVKTPEKTNGYSAAALKK